MSDEIQFGTLHPDGSLTNQRGISRSAIAACPFYIMVPEHYREDNTCRCDEGFYDEETGVWTLYTEVPDGQARSFEIVRRLFPLGVFAIAHKVHGSYRVEIPTGSFEGIEHLLELIEQEGLEA
jgi:hypothetical protein